MEICQGRTAARLCESDLRDVEIGGVPVAQRIYTAVRDEQWNTLPAHRVSATSWDSSDEQHHRFVHHYSAGNLSYEQDTHYAIADRRIMVEILGVAQGDFRYNRIGVCVLIDQAMAGRPFRAWRDGRLIGDGTLSATVAPQTVADGRQYPYIGPFDALAVDTPSAIPVEYHCQGDLFELEDQRNWTDSSYKIYSTPLEDGWPLDARAGQTFRQRVVVTMGDANQVGDEAARGPGRTDDPPRTAQDGRPRVITSSRPERAVDRTVTVRHGEPLGRSVPRIGVTLAEAELTASQLASIHPHAVDHLRVDVDPSVGTSARWESQLRDAAHRTGAGIEWAIHLGGMDRSAAELLARMAHHVPVDRILLHRDGMPCTDGALACDTRALVPEELKAIPMMAGASTNFVDLNRARPDMAGADGVYFPIVPTVHADDDESVLDNARAQTDVVASATELFGGLPVVASVASIRPVGRLVGRPASQRRAPMDRRQFTSFGALWAVKSLQHLTRAGTSSVTFHHSVARATDDPPPLYRVLDWMAGWRNARALAWSASSARESAPRSLCGFIFARDGAFRAILGNTGMQQIQLGMEGSVLSAVEMMDDSGRSLVHRADSHGTRGSQAPDRAPDDRPASLVTIPPRALICIDYSRTTAGPGAAGGQPESRPDS